MDSNGSMKQPRRYFKYLPGMEPSLLSLNDYAADVPDGDGVFTRQNLKRGRDIFSHGVLISEAEAVFPEYDGGSDKNVIGFLNKKLRSDENDARAVCGITDRLSIGLAAIIHSLRTGSREDRSYNDLTEADWRFWRTCTAVFFVGKIAEGRLGQLLECGIASYLDRFGDKGISVRCPGNCGIKTPSLLGCAKAAGISEGAVYVFDLGNTAFKCGRAVFASDRCTVDERPAAIHRDYLSLGSSLAAAEQIHDQIVSTITQTTAYYRDDSPAYRISMCMANNIINGEIMDRGSYRSLRLLSHSYPHYLGQYLERATGKRVTVRMMNDAEAVAVLFKEWSPHAAVITLGTQMGIAYP